MTAHTARDSAPWYVRHAGRIVYWQFVTALIIATAVRPRWDSWLILGATLGWGIRSRAALHLDMRGTTDA